MEQSALLRAATQRLVTTPTEDLPRIAGFIASSLASCSAVLNGDAGKSSDSSIPRHKLQTRISSLLRDRTAAGRSTAAVIIKSLAEASRPTESAIWESWARGLIGCLNKPDPWEVKRIYLIATVRIFLLGRGSQTIQREVTIPLLPPFINTCLAAIKPITARHGQESKVVPSPLLPTVLRSWDELVQHHPATFRPFVPRIRPICLSLIGDFSSATDLRQLAVKLLASLHSCAPKASTAGEWQLSVTNSIKAVHGTLDLVLRGVREEWTSNDSAQARSSIRHDYSKEPELTENDVASLGTWRGIHQGIMRACRLLEWMVEMLRCQSSSVAVPLGLLLDLTARIVAVTVPRRNNEAQSHLRTNPEVAKEERESLWVDLPTLHVSCLNLISMIVETHGQAINTLMIPVSAQVFDIFLAEGWHEEVRSQCYTCLSVILQTTSCTSLELDRQGIEGICKSCCRDLSRLLPQLSEHNGGSEAVHGVQGNPKILQFKSQGIKSTGTAARIDTQVIHNAYLLLPLFVEKLPSRALSHASRTELDRMSIFLDHERAMLASVMNPPGRQLGQRVLPSILPFFARAGVDGDMGLQAIMKPRMPVVSELFTPVLDKAREQNYEDFLIDEVHSLEQRRDQPETMVEQPKARIETRTPDKKEQLESFPKPDQASHDTILGKRDFAELTEAPTKSRAANPEPQGPSDNSKRLRMEDQDGLMSEGGLLREAPIVLNGTVAVGSTAVQGDRTSAGTPTLPQFGTENTVMDRKAGAALTQGDSDSDSDIPEINPELATDEEFEDDDEEEE